MFDALFDFFADLLSWLYDIWPSYAGAIALFTLIIMAVMAPVTVRQTRSMLAMSRLQPEVKRLREKYGDDRDRLNQEMMALYQANGVNPLGGCLPILIQMPIFLVLFRLVQGLTRRVSDIGIAVGDASTRQPDEVLSEFPERTFNPEFLDTGSKLFQDLAESTQMNWLKLDLALSPSQALGDSIVSGFPYLVMVIAVGVTSWIQQRQIQGRSTNANVNPQQQAIMKILPFMLPVFSFGFPAALIVYFLVSNLFRVAQQVFITKKVYGEQKDDSEIVRPEPAAKVSSDGDKAKPAAKQQRQGSSSGHGSRRPVSNPPKKRKKKPAPSSGSAKSDGNRPRKGKVDERKEPAKRPQSKRVTPKKSDQTNASEQRGRNKKKR